MCKVCLYLFINPICFVLVSVLVVLNTVLQAGKGRTGLMVCAYLVYTGMSADEALQLYADRRTTNNEGVSYIRYNTKN